MAEATPDAVKKGIKAHAADALHHTQKFAGAAADHARQGLHTANAHVAKHLDSAPSA